MCPLLQMAPTSTARGVDKSRKRAADIKLEWIPRFGIVVTAVDPSKKRAFAVNCRFCLSFGRETIRVGTRKVLKHPFWTDKFRQHLRQQHD